MTKTRSAAYVEGRLAFNEFKEVYENPYPLEDPRCQDWEAGWTAAYHTCRGVN